LETFAVTQSAASPLPELPHPQRGRMARHIVAAMVLTLAVVVPRSLIILRDHSTCVDDTYHLYRGLELLRGDWVVLNRLFLNDPPVGEAISAIPAWLSGVHLQDNLKVYQQVPDLPPPPPNCYTMPDSLRAQTMIWKAVLFLPAIAVLFQWVATVYSYRSAWLAVAMVLVEPNIAAHLPLPTVDVLGMEGILIGCWALWRFVTAPTWGRMLVAGSAVGLALVIKHTALILPPVAVLMAIVHWVFREKLWRRPRKLVGNIGMAALTALCAFLTIWVLCGFDFSQPLPNPLGEKIFGEDFVDQFILPAGIYFKSVFYALAHARQGQPNYLWGEVRWDGWLYYFPVVAGYKIPLGIGAIALLGVASVAWVRPRYAELPLLICGLAWTASLMNQSVDIGIRHFLPAEIFLLMLMSRCVAVPMIASTALAWVAVATAAIDVARWTPDYMSYINFSRQQIYLQISDSNLDWGQGRKMLKKWLDGLPADGRPVYYGYFGPMDVNLYEELGPRLTEYTSCSHWVRRPEMPQNSPDFVPDKKHVMPDHGLLVLSGIAYTGQYDEGDHFAALRRSKIEPNAMLGNYLLIYDLDQLRSAGKFP
jgi:hypothetical protein